MFFLGFDYATGAHPQILKALTQHNHEVHDTYGGDVHTDNAKKLIQKHLDNNACDIHFLVGGTQANLLLISHALNHSFEAVIAADSGHIAMFEAGAIEATGHKILTIDTRDSYGKLTLTQLKQTVKEHDFAPHMALPKMVYISQPTQAGRLYTHQELSDIYNFCQQSNLYFFIDGARLAVALGSDDNDVSLADLSRISDAFYIGATKAGALFGEALVITNTSLSTNIRYSMKQKGALLAKGWLLGIQFEELFRDQLYYEIGRHEYQCALRMRDGLVALGIHCHNITQTNYVYPIFSPSLFEALSKIYPLRAAEVDGLFYITMLTSWSTTYVEIDGFLDECRRILSGSR